MCEQVEVTTERRHSSLSGLASLFRLAGSGARRAVDLIVPPVCLGCRAPMGDHGGLCPSCWRGIDFIRPPLCDRLGLPLPFNVAGGPGLSAAALIEPPAYDRCRAVARYSGTMRRLVKDLKFHDRHDGREVFGRWLVEAGGALVAEADVVVPVPLTRWRLAARRFNQSAILAREVSRRAGLAFLPGALVRTRRTRPQPGLSRAERKANVRGAFAVPEAARRAIQGRAVLLVDDVVTTGATVEACARALQSAGAIRVDVLALALATDSVLTPD